MPVFAITILRAVGAALLSILTKVLSEAFVERMVASVTFAGLSKLSSKSTNQLDDSLIADAAESYYGAGNVPAFLQKHVDAAQGLTPPVSPVPGPVIAPPSQGTGDEQSPPEGPVAAAGAPTKDNFVQEAKAAVVASDLGRAIPAQNQESAELKELR